MVGKVVVGDRTVERDSHMYTVGRRKQPKHNIYYFQLHGSLPSTFSIPVHLMYIRSTLVTEQLYIPESLSARLLISSCDFPGLLTILLPSPIRSALPSFSQRIFRAGMPAKEHVSLKRLPCTRINNCLGRFLVVGRAVGEGDIDISD